MRYTIALQNSRDRACVQASTGVVVFNGLELMPYEADMIGKALLDCADKADTLAADAASQLQPDVFDAVRGWSVSAARLALLDVLRELGRATAKFPTWPTDPLHAIAVIGEEFGELTKDALQLTYEPHKTSTDNLRSEAIQTAAMALRFAISLDRYEPKPSEQHEQDARELLSEVRASMPPAVAA